MNCSNFTHRLSAHIARTYPGALYYVDTDKKLIALTIDDGPDSVATPLILEVLEKYKAKATFFLITNNITGNEDIVKQIVQNGHELGNHMTQDEPTFKLEKTDFIIKFNQADSILSIYDTVHWFRPGGGRYSDFMIDYLKQEKRGYLCALGSVYPFDTIIPFSSFASFYILKNIRPGSIIILHDYGNRGKRTAEALNKVLPELKADGYEVVTLSELYNTVN